MIDSSTVNPRCAAGEHEERHRRGLCPRERAPRDAVAADEGGGEV